MRKRGPIIADTSLLAAFQDLHARLDQAVGRIYKLEMLLTSKANASPIQCYSPVEEVDGQFEVEVRDIDCPAVMDACTGLETVPDEETP